MYLYLALKANEKINEIIIIIVIIIITMRNSWNPGMLVSTWRRARPGEWTTWCWKKKVAKLMWRIGNQRPQVAIGKFRMIAVKTATRGLRFFFFFPLMYQSTSPLPASLLDSWPTGGPFLWRIVVATVFPPISVCPLSFFSLHFFSFSHCIW